MKPLYILLGLSSLVLLLACVNIANLMFASAPFRGREMSVRMALGAGRGRILRQVLTESFLLSAMGGSAGLILGYFGRNLIPWLSHTGWNQCPIPVGFDWRGTLNLMRSSVPFLLAPPLLPMEAIDAARPPPRGRPCGWSAHLGIRLLNGGPGGTKVYQQRPEGPA
jgi:ABC-type antimicrobial peptide transport system permease subunit